MPSSLVNDVPDILKKIMAVKAEEIARAESEISMNELDERIRSMGVVRPFTQSINKQRQQEQYAIIAEVKKASPSKGIIRADFKPAHIAKRYEEGGATCLSVLTDEQFFQGHRDYLVEARNACDLPVLRKDFMVTPYHIAQSRAMGADCILLIVAALEQAQLADLYASALHYGLDVLIEVHDEQELERAYQLDRVENALIGVNNRDLRTFNTDLNTTIRLASLLADNQKPITESGIHSMNEISMMRQNGIYGFLVGEAFMRADDPGLALATLFKR